MKSHLHKIEISNFKAFRDFSLNLEGRHLLVSRQSGHEQPHEGRGDSPV